MAKKKRAPRKPETTSLRSSSAHAASPSGISRRVVIVVLLAVTFLAFANSIFYDDFAYDDNTQILKDPFIRSLSNLPKAMVTEAWFWRVQQDRDPNKADKPSTPYYRPAFTIYLMIGWKAFEDWAPGWHLVSVLLHLLAVFLAFLILEEVSGETMLAGIAALLFAIHPLRSESVAWISGATDLLLAVFMLASFHQYLVFRKNGKKLNLLWAVLLFLVASFCKEPGVSLPMFIAAYELFIVGRDSEFKKRLKTTAVYTSPFLLVSAFYFGMRFYSLGFLLSDKNYTNYPTTSVLLTIPIVICKYIGLLFWPVNLSIYHSTPLVASPVDLRFFVPVLFLIAVGFLLRPAWKNSVARFGILWFVANLIPVLNLYAFETYFMVQERYIYLASIGFSLLVALALTRAKLERWIPVSARRTAVAIVVVLICVLLTGKTFAQNMVWKDSMTMFIHGAEVADDQSISHYILGHQYIKTQQWEKVADELEKCVALNPKGVVAINNLANAHLLLYEKTRDTSHVLRAASLCEEGLKQVTDRTDNDTKASLWDTLGHAYAYDSSIQNFDRALSCFGQALQISPTNPLINAHVGAVLIKQNKFQQALPYLEEARKAAPQLADIYKFLGYTYGNLGRTKEAIDSLNMYLALQPNAVDAPQEKRHLDALQAKLQGADQSDKKPSTTAQN